MYYLKYYIILHTCDCELNVEALICKRSVWDNLITSCYEYY